MRRLEFGSSGVKQSKVAGSREVKKITDLRLQIKISDSGWARRRTSSGGVDLPLSVKSALEDLKSKLSFHDLPSFSVDRSFASGIEASPMPVSRASARVSGLSRR